jgi:Spherulation-specific family 4
MHFCHLFLAIPLLLSPIHAAYISFPIYINPSPSAWAPLYSAIAANPQLLFQLILNPNSGPGSGKYPSSAYITAITTLRKYSNVQLIGYVHISYCNRNIVQVESDISTYAGWSTYTGANIHLDGIFFDEAPESYTTFDFSYLTNATNYARAAFKGGHLNLNPGILCDSRYFSLVDTVNVFESPYSSFKNPTTLNAIPVTERKNSTILIYSFKGTTSQQASLVSVIANSSIGGMYITTTGGYTSFSKDWTQFVTAVAATVRSPAIRRRL